MYTVSVVFGDWAYICEIFFKSNFKAILYLLGNFVKNTVNTLIHLEELILMCIEIRSTFLFRVGQVKVSLLGKIK